MSTFDRHIQSILLQQRGQNQKLVNDINTLLPEDSKERLFRVLQDMEMEIRRERHNARKFMPMSLVGQFIGR